MLITFKRELVIPLSAVVLGAAALSTAPRVMPAVTALVGVAVAASTVSALLRWFRSSRRPSIEVLDREPRKTISAIAGADARTLNPTTRARIQEADDAADLVRMDDDGG